LAWSHDEAAKRLARFGIILANEPIPAPNLRPESAKLKSNLYFCGLPESLAISY